MRLSGATATTWTSASARRLLAGQPAHDNQNDNNNYNQFHDGSFLVKYGSSTWLLDEISGQQIDERIRIDT